MKKFIVITLVWLTILLIVAPIFVSLAINSIDEMNNSSNFSKDTWLSFIGSYIGAIVTAIVLFITIQYNKKLIDKRIEEQKFKQNVDNEKDIVNKIIDLVLLEKYEYINDRGRDFFFYDRLKYDISQIKSIIKNRPDTEFYDLVYTIINKYESLIPDFTEPYQKTLMLIGASADAIEMVVKSSESDLYDARDEYFKKLNENMAQEIRNVYK